MAISFRISRGRGIGSDRTSARPGDMRAARVVPPGAGSAAAGPALLVQALAPGDVGRRGLGAQALGWGAWAAGCTSMVCLTCDLELMF